VKQTLNLGTNIKSKLPGIKEYGSTEKITRVVLLTAILKEVSIRLM